MKQASLFFLLAVLLFIGCKKDSQPPVAQEPPQLWPLKMGNRWIYTRTAYYEDGTVKNNFSDTLTVVGKTQKDNETYFQLLWSTRANEIPPLLRTEEAAVYAYSENSKKSLLLFKHPVAEGEVLYTETNGESIQKCIAAVALYPTDSRQTHKVIIRNWDKGTLTSYLLVDFKPGIGLSEQASYTLKASGTNFYKSFEAALRSYSFK